MHDSRTRQLVRLLAAGLALAALVPAVAAAAPSGAVEGTISTPPPVSPCILLDSTSTNFGTHPFQVTGSPDFRLGAPATSITNCSGGFVKLFARVSDATSTESRDVWTPYTGANECPSRGLNRFTYRVAIGQLSSVLQGTDGRVPVYETVPSGSARSIEHAFVLPCEGSDGAGLAMTTTATFTATL